MNCRRHGRKPTLALWMLVAIVDLAILATAAGALLTFSIVASLAVLAGGVLAARLGFGLQSVLGGGRGGRMTAEPGHRGRRA